MSIVQRALVAAPVAVALVLPIAGFADAAGVAHPSTLPRTSSTSSLFTASKSVSRVNLVNGQNIVVDNRTVRVTVSATQDLRNGQQVLVSWRGAHPTGGIRLDPNSVDAIYQEFPVVLLECRGKDTTSVPSAQRVSPETCWTQFPQERFQRSGVNFPEYRVDRYATVAQRAAIVNAPAVRPATCFLSPSEYWLPFISATGHVYPGGNGGCAGVAPEASSSNAGGLTLPPNDTYAATAVDGTGSAKFQIWTVSQNASLGCSQTVPCTLEVIPIEGISCDTAAAGLPAQDQPQPGIDEPQTTTECLRNGGYKPGTLASAGAGVSDLGVSGALWWSASNWRNRIATPLSFAPEDNVCSSIVTARGSAPIYGSELMIQATNQWAPAFCLDPSRYPITHVQVGEPQAAIGLSSGTGINAAFVSDPPSTGWARPVVTAPTAVTGFAIAYTIDDAQHHEYLQLKLDPRLLAKLLTESYPAVTAVQSSYPPLSGNPLDMSVDPEFRALNPGLATLPDPGLSAATLLTMSGSTDVMTALTSYINADPEARAWLDGKPDPWGMKVNPAYKGIPLPVSHWPLLDTYEPTALYRLGINDCLYASPVPFLPLVNAPLPRLELITQSIEFAISNAQVQCSEPVPNSTDGAKLVAQGRQPIGYRFLLGIVPLADVSRYQLTAAALLSHTAPTAASAFTTAAGRTFVTPTAASMRAAVATLHPDQSTGTWPLPYATWRTTTAGASAYPGTMVVYTAVPTQGLAAADAHHYADFLRFAGTSGQVLGSGSGQLPDGYLPMTAANGLGQMASYTLTAADAVEAQRGQLPPLVAVKPVGTPSPSSPAGSTGAPGGSGATGAGAAGGGATAASTHPGLTGPTSRSVALREKAGASAGGGRSSAAVGFTTGVSPGRGSTALDILLLLAALALGVAVAVVAQAAVASRR